MELNKNKRWESVCKDPYDKADQDIFGRLSNLLDIAHAQALEIDLHHCRTVNTALKKNPSTQLYELIATLIGVRTGAKCPITGTWKLVDDASVTIKLDKGDSIPTHKGNAVHWQL